MASLRLRAVNTIQRATKPGKAADKAKGTPAIPPEIETIKPGTVFTAEDQKQFDELTAGPRPAAVAVKDDADDAKKAPAKKAPTKKAPTKKAPAKKDEKPEGADTQTGGEGDDTQTGGEGADGEGGEGEDDLV